MTQYIYDFFYSALDTYLEMAPYLIFGFFMAGVLSIFISKEKVEKHLGGHGGILPVIKAAIFGVPLPLCSCSVIPVSLSLRKHGATRAATTSFLLSAPQTGVDSILVTYSLLGPVFAIVRPIAAFLSGIVGGILVMIFGEKKEAHLHESHKGCNACCHETEVKNKIGHIFKYSFDILPRDIAKALIVGIIVASLLSSLIPPDFFSLYIGSGIAGMIVMMALGIPIYVCATASVPIAAAFIAKGVSPGAALVFLMTGPATNAATIGAIWSMMGKRTAIVYLLAVIITSLISGITLDYVFQFKGVFMSMVHHGWMLPDTIKYISGIILIIILGRAMLMGKPKENNL